MSHRRGRLAAGTLGFALALLLALPAGAAAASFTTPPQTSGMSATLPLLGSSLTVDVALDANGNLSSVSLNPVGDFTATKDHPHFVKFQNTDGSVKVSITAWGGAMALKAKAGSLSALEGSGTWSADIFGTGDTTTVHYTVGDDGSGAPTVAIDSVNAPSGVTVTQNPPTTKTWGDFASARVSADFAWNGFTKHLAIATSVGSKKDDSGARLQIVLWGDHSQKLSGTLADVLGSHTWSGKLCDGTTVGVAFQVVDDGTGNGKVTYDPNTFATGGTAKAKAFGNGFVAWFTNKGAAVAVSLRKAQDGTYTLRVASFAGRWCDKGTTPANPTLNTPVSPDATKGPDKFHGGHGKHLGFGFGHGRQKGHK